MEWRDRVRRQAILIGGIVVLAAIAYAPLFGGEVTDDGVYGDVELPGGRTLHERRSSEGVFEPYHSVVSAEVDPMVVARWDEGAGGYSAGGDSTTIAMESGAGGGALSNSRVQGGAVGAGGGGGAGDFRIESIADGNQIPIWWVKDGGYDFGGGGDDDPTGSNGEDDPEGPENPENPEPSVPEPSAFLVFAIGAGILSRATRR